MKKVTVKKDMFYSLLIPYILLGIVAVVFYGYMYNTSVRNINNESIQSSRSILNKIAREIDYLVSDIERLVLEVDSNYKFKRILDVDEKEKTGQDHYEIAVAINELRTTKKYNYLIEDIILYYHQGNFFINSVGARTAELLYSDYSLNTNKDHEEWNAKLKGKYPEGGLIKIAGEIFYIITIPINEEEEASNVIIKINTKKFNELISSYSNLNEGRLYILDQGFNILGTNYVEGIGGSRENSIPGSIEDKKRAIESLRNKEVGTVLLDNTEYIGMYIEENSSDLDYIWLIEKYKLKDKSKYILLSFVGMGIAFTAILAFGMVSVKKNYKKIEDIVERLSKSELSVEDRKYSEVTYINNTLSNIEEKMKSQEKMMVESIIRKSIYGLIEDRDENFEYLLKNEEVLCQGRSIITIFEDVDIEGKQAKELKLGIFIIDNIIKEIFNGGIKSWIIPLDSWYVVVLNWNDEDEYEPDYILEGLEKTRKFLAMQLGAKYTIGVSSPVLGISHFDIGYKEAVEALDEKQIIGNNKMIYYGNIEEHHNQYAFDENKHKQFMNYIRLGDIEKATRLIEEIYEVNFKEKQISAECGRLLLLDLLETLKQVSDEIGYCIEIDTKDVFKKSHTVYDMKEKIFGMTTELCKYGGQSKERISDREEKIIKYILDHYSDVNLNVSMIADQFDLNASYLSRLFKEQTGENLLSYINNYRVEKAKELLAITSKTLVKIATETGFLNTAALTRAFKKYEGVTPSQYKEIHRNKE